MVLFLILKGVHTYGGTILEVKNNLKEAIKCHVQGLLKDNEPVPQESETPGISMDSSRTRCAFWNSGSSGNTQLHNCRNIGRCGARFSGFARGAVFFWRIQCVFVPFGSSRYFINLVDSFSGHKRTPIIMSEIQTFYLIVVIALFALAIVLYPTLSKRNK